MISGINVGFQCERCPKSEFVQVDFWFSVNGEPNLRLETGRARLEREGWTFTPREGKFEPWQGKFKALCNECTSNAMKVNIKTEEA